MAAVVPPLLGFLGELGCLFLKMCCLADLLLRVVLVARPLSGRKFGLSHSPTLPLSVVLVFVCILYSVQKLAEQWLEIS